MNRYLAEASVRTNRSGLRITIFIYIYIYIYIYIWVDIWRSGHWETVWCAKVAIDSIWRESPGRGFRSNFWSPQSTHTLLRTSPNIRNNSVEHFLRVGPLPATLKSSPIAPIEDRLGQNLKIPWSRDRMLRMLRKSPEQSRDECAFDFKHF